MDVDTALTRAFDLGMEGGWTDEVMEEAERLLPTLIAAGYARRDGYTWAFTPEGVARMAEIEAEAEAG
jgi:hypothetical protein